MRVWSRKGGERIVGIRFKYVEILWSVRVRGVCGDSGGVVEYQRIVEDGRMKDRV